MVRRHPQDGAARRGTHSSYGIGLLEIGRQPRSSELLAGTFIDPANGRRSSGSMPRDGWAASWRLEVEGTAFVEIEDDDPLFGLRRDHTSV